MGSTTESLGGREAMTYGDPSLLLPFGEVVLSRTEEDCVQTGAPRQVRLGIRPPVALTTDEALVVIKGLEQHSLEYGNISCGRLFLDGTDDSTVDERAVAETLTELLTSEPLKRVSTAVVQLSL